MQHPETTEIIEELTEIPDDGDVLEPLINTRRRFVIRYMSRLDKDAKVGTTELSRACAAIENDCSIADITNSQYRKAYQALRSRDLKRLSLTGIIDQHDKETIERGEEFERFAETLNAVDEILLRRVA